MGRREEWRTGSDGQPQRTWVFDSQAELDRFNAREQPARDAEFARIAQENIRVGELNRAVDLHKAYPDLAQKARANFDAGRDPNVWSAGSAAAALAEAYRILNSSPAAVAAAGARLTAAGSRAAQIAGALHRLPPGNGDWDGAGARTFAETTASRAQKLQVMGAANTVAGAALARFSATLAGAQPVAAHAINMWIEGSRQENVNRAGLIAAHSHGDAAGVTAAQKGMTEGRVKQQAALNMITGIVNEAKLSGAETTQTLRQSQTLLETAAGASSGKQAMQALSTLTAGGTGYGTWKIAARFPGLALVGGAVAAGSYAGNEMKKAVEAKGGGLGSVPAALQQYGKDVVEAWPRAMGGLQTMFGGSGADAARTAWAGQLTDLGNYVYTTGGPRDVVEGVRAGDPVRSAVGGGLTALTAKGAVDTAAAVPRVASRLATTAGQAAGWASGVVRHPISGLVGKVGLDLEGSQTLARLSRAGDPPLLSPMAAPGTQLVNGHPARVVPNAGITVLGPDGLVISRTPPKALPFDVEYSPQPRLPQYVTPDRPLLNHHGATITVVAESLPDQPAGWSGRDPILPPGTDRFNRHVMPTWVDPPLVRGGPEASSLPPAGGSAAPGAPFGAGPAGSPGGGGHLPVTVTGVAEPVGARLAPEHGAPARLWTPGSAIEAPQLPSVIPAMSLSAHQVTAAALPNAHGSAVPQASPDAPLHPSRSAWSSPGVPAMPFPSAADVHAAMQQAPVPPVFSGASAASPTGLSPGAPGLAGGPSVSAAAPPPVASPAAPGLAGGPSVSAAAPPPAALPTTPAVASPPAPSAPNGAPQQQTAAAPSGRPPSAVLPLDVREPTPRAPLLISVAPGEPLAVRHPAEGAAVGARGPQDAPRPARDPAGAPVTVRSVMSPVAAEVLLPARPLAVAPGDPAAPAAGPTVPAADREESREALPPAGAAPDGDAAVRPNTAPPDPRQVAPEAGPAQGGARAAETLARIAEVSRALETTSVRQGSTWTTAGGGPVDDLGRRFDGLVDDLRLSAPGADLPAVPAALQIHRALEELALAEAALWAQGAAAPGARAIPDGERLRREQQLAEAVQRVRALRDDPPAGPLPDGLTLTPYVHDTGDVSAARIRLPRIERELDDPFAGGGTWESRAADLDRLGRERAEHLALVAAHEERIAVLRRLAGPSQPQTDALGSGGGSAGDGLRKAPAGEGSERPAEHPVVETSRLLAALAALTPTLAEADPASALARRLTVERNALLDRLTELHPSLPQGLPPAEPYLSRDPGGPPPGRAGEPTALTAQSPRLGSQETSQLPGSLAALLEKHGLELPDDGRRYVSPDPVGEGSGVPEPAPDPALSEPESEGSGSAGSFTANVMSPLLVSDWPEFRRLLGVAKAAGVDGLSVDVWWGVVGQAEGRFDWVSYYDRVFSEIADAGLGIVAIFSFHETKKGGNVGDDVDAPIPLWLPAKYAGERVGDEVMDLAGLWHVSEHGNASVESVQGFADQLVRNDYYRFAKDFAEHYSEKWYAHRFLEINVSGGPAGELRYPSYNKHDAVRDADGNIVDDRTGFPTRGALQAYSPLARQSFRRAVLAKYGDLAGVNTAWGTSLRAVEQIGPPDDGDRFFSSGAYRFQRYGQDFVDWYNGSLVEHGHQILNAVLTGLGDLLPDANIGYKMPGIHWTMSHPTWPSAAAVAAGLVQTSVPWDDSTGHGYEALVRLATRVQAGTGREVVLHFTCLEFDNEDFAPQHSRAKDLVFWIAQLANRLGVTLMGENALSSVSGRGYDNIRNAILWGPYRGINILRIGELERNLAGPDEPPYLGAQAYSAIITEQRQNHPSPLLPDPPARPLPDPDAGPRQFLDNVGEDPSERGFPTISTDPPGEEPTWPVGNRAAPGPPSSAGSSGVPLGVSPAPEVLAGGGWGAGELLGIGAHRADPAGALPRVGSDETGSRVLGGGVFDEVSDPTWLPFLPAIEAGLSALVGWRSPADLPDLTRLNRLWDGVAIGTPSGAVMRVRLVPSGGATPAGRRAFFRGSEEVADAAGPGVTEVSFPYNEDKSQSGVSRWRTTAASLRGQLATAVSSVAGLGVSLNVSGMSRRREELVANGYTTSIAVVTGSGRWATFVGDATLQITADGAGAADAPPPGMPTAPLQVPVRAGYRLPVEMTRPPGASPFGPDLDPVVQHWRDRGRVKVVPGRQRDVLTTLLAAEAFSFGSLPAAAAAVLGRRFFDAEVLPPGELADTLAHLLSQKHAERRLRDLSAGVYFSGVALPPHQGQPRTGQFRVETRVVAVRVVGVVEHSFVAMSKVRRQRGEVGGADFALGGRASVEVNVGSQKGEQPTGLHGAWSASVAAGAGAESTLLSSGSGDDLTWERAEVAPSGPMVRVALSTRSTVSLLGGELGQWVPPVERPGEAVVLVPLADLPAFMAGLGTDEVAEPDAPAEPDSTGQVREPVPPAALAAGQGLGGGVVDAMTGASAVLDTAGNLAWQALEEAAAPHGGLSTSEAEKQQLRLALSTWFSPGALTARQKSLVQIGVRSQPEVVRTVDGTSLELSVVVQARIDGAAVAAVPGLPNAGWGIGSDARRFRGGQETRRVETSGSGSLAGPAGSLKDPQGSALSGPDASRSLDRASAGVSVVGVGHGAWAGTNKGASAPAATDAFVAPVTFEISVRVDEVRTPGSGGAVGTGSGPVQLSAALPGSLRVQVPAGFTLGVTPSSTRVPARTVESSLKAHEWPLEVRGTPQLHGLLRQVMAAAGVPEAASAGAFGYTGEQLEPEPLRIGLHTLLDPRDGVRVPVFDGLIYLGTLQVSAVLLDVEGRGPVSDPAGVLMSLDDHHQAGRMAGSTLAQVEVGTTSSSGRSGADVLGPDGEPVLGGRLQHRDTDLRVDQDSTNQYLEVHVDRVVTAAAVPVDIELRHLRWEVSFRPALAQRLLGAAVVERAQDVLDAVTLAVPRPRHPFRRLQDIPLLAPPVDAAVRQPTPREQQVQRAVLAGTPLGSFAYPPGSSSEPVWAAVDRLLRDNGMRYLTEGRHGTGLRDVLVRDWSSLLPHALADGLDIPLPPVPRLHGARRPWLRITATVVPSALSRLPVVLGADEVRVDRVNERVDQTGPQSFFLFGTPTSGSGTLRSPGALTGGVSIGAEYSRNHARLTAGAAGAAPMVIHQSNTSLSEDHAVFDVPVRVIVRVVTDDVSTGDLLPDVLVPAPRFLRPGLGRLVDDAGARVAELTGGTTRTVSWVYRAAVPTVLLDDRLPVARAGRPDPDAPGPASPFKPSRETLHQGEVVLHSLDLGATGDARDLLVDSLSDPGSEVGRWIGRSPHTVGAGLRTVLSAEVLSSHADRLLAGEQVRLLVGTVTAGKDLVVTVSAEFGNLTPIGWVDGSQSKMALRMQNESTATILIDEAGHGVTASLDRGNVLPTHLLIRGNGVVAPGLTTTTRTSTALDPGTQASDLRIRGRRGPVLLVSADALITAVATVSDSNATPAPPQRLSARAHVHHGALLSLTPELADRLGLEPPSPQVRDAGARQFLENLGEDPSQHGFPSISTDPPGDDSQGPAPDRRAADTPVEPAATPAPSSADRALREFPVLLERYRQQLGAFERGEIGAAELGHAQLDAYWAWQRTFDGELLGSAELSAAFVDTVRRADLARAARQGHRPGAGSEPPVVEPAPSASPVPLQRPEFARARRLTDVLHDVGRRLDADPRNRAALRRAKRLRTRLGWHLGSILLSMDVNRAELERAAAAGLSPRAEEARWLVEALATQYQALVEAWRPVGRAAGLTQPVVRRPDGSKSPILGGFERSVEMVGRHGPRAVLAGTAVTLALTGANFLLNLLPEERTGPPIENATQELRRLVSDPDYMRRNYWDPLGNVPGHVVVEEVNGIPRNVLVAPLDLYELLYVEELVRQGDTDTPGTLWRDVLLPGGTPATVEVRPPFRHPSQWVVRRYYQSVDPANEYNGVADVRYAFGPLTGRSTEVTLNVFTGGGNVRNDMFLFLGLNPLTLRPNHLEFRQQMTNRAFVASAKFAPVAHDPARFVDRSVPRNNLRLGYEVGALNLYSIAGLRDLQSVVPRGGGVDAVARGTPLSETGAGYLPLMVFGRHDDGSVWSVVPLYGHLELPLYPLDTRLTLGSRGALKAGVQRLNADLPEIGFFIMRARGVLPSYLSPVSLLQALVRPSTIRRHPVRLDGPTLPPQPYLPSARRRTDPLDDGDPRPVEDRRPGPDADPLRVESPPDILRRAGEKPEEHGFPTVATDPPDPAFAPPGHGSRAALSGTPEGEVPAGWSAAFADLYARVLGDIARPLTGALMGPALPPARRAEVKQAIHALYADLGHALLRPGVQVPGRDRPFDGFVGSTTQLRLERRLARLHREFAVEIGLGSRANIHGPAGGKDLPRLLDTLVRDLAANPGATAERFLLAASPVRPDGTRPGVHVLGLAQNGATLAAVVWNAVRRRSGGQQVPLHLGFQLPVGRAPSGRFGATRFESTLDPQLVRPGDTVVLVDDGIGSGHSIDTALAAVARDHGDDVTLFIVVPHFFSHGPATVWRDVPVLMLQRTNHLGLFAPTTPPPQTAPAPGALLARLGASRGDVSRLLEQGLGADFEPSTSAGVLGCLDAAPVPQGILRLSWPGRPPVLVSLRKYEGAWWLLHPPAGPEFEVTAATLVGWVRSAGFDPRTRLRAAVSVLPVGSGAFDPPEGPLLPAVDLLPALPPAAERERPAEDSAYGASVPAVRLVLAGLARHLPGASTNPRRGTSNCVSAAWAADLRAAGIPAEAIDHPLAGAYLTPQDVIDWYGSRPEQGYGALVDGAYLLPPGRRFDRTTLEVYLRSLPDGARGLLFVHWPGPAAGHVVLVTRTAGAVSYLDPQTGLLLDLKALSSAAVHDEHLLDVYDADTLPDRADTRYAFLRTDLHTTRYEQQGLHGLPDGVRSAQVLGIDAGGRVRISSRFGWDLVDVAGTSYASTARIGESVFIAPSYRPRADGDSVVIPQNLGPWPTTRLGQAVVRLAALVAPDGVDGSVLDVTPELVAAVSGDVPFRDALAGVIAERPELRVVFVGRFEVPNLSGLDLRRADFSQAHLRHPDLRGSDLRGARLAGAVIENPELLLAAAHWEELRTADLWCPVQPHWPLGSRDEAPAPAERPGWDPSRSLELLLRVISRHLVQTTQVDGSAVRRRGARGAAAAGPEPAGSSGEHGRETDFYGAIRVVLSDRTERWFLVRGERLDLLEIVPDAPTPNGVQVRPLGAPVPRPDDRLVPDLMFWSRPGPGPGPGDIVDGEIESGRPGLEDFLRRQGGAATTLVLDGFSPDQLLQPAVLGADLLALHRWYTRSGGTFRVELRASRLPGVYLPQAPLRDAVLIGVDLRGATLTGADLRGARLTDVDLTAADLDGADLRGADLRGARLDLAQLRQTRVSATTLLPERQDRTPTEVFGSFVVEQCNLPPDSTEQAMIQLETLAVLAAGGGTGAHAGRGPRHRGILLTFSVTDVPSPVGDFTRRIVLDGGVPLLVENNDEDLVPLQGLRLTDVVPDGVARFAHRATTAAEPPDALERAAIPPGRTTWATDIEQVLDHLRSQQADGGAFVAYVTWWRGSERATDMVASLDPETGEGHLAQVVEHPRADEPLGGALPLGVVKGRYVVPTGGSPGAADPVDGVFTYRLVGAGEADQRARYAPNYAALARALPLGTAATGYAARRDGAAIRIRVAWVGGSLTLRPPMGRRAVDALGPIRYQVVSAAPRAELPPRRPSPAAAGFYGDVSGVRLGQTYRVPAEEYARRSPLAAVLELARRYLDRARFTDRGDALRVNILGISSGRTPWTDHVQLELASVDSPPVYLDADGEPLPADRAGRPLVDGRGRPVLLERRRWTEVFVEYHVMVDGDAEPALFDQTGLNAGSATDGRDLVMPLDGYAGVPVPSGSGAEQGAEPSDFVEPPAALLEDWDPLPFDTQLAADLASGFAVIGRLVGRGSYGAVHAIGYAIDHPAAAAREVPSRARMIKLATTIPPAYTVPFVDDWEPDTLQSFENEVASVLRAARAVPLLRTADPRIVTWTDADGESRFGISMDLVDAPHSKQISASPVTQPLPEVVGWEHVSTLRAVREQIVATATRIEDFQGFYLPGGGFLLIDPRNAGWTGRRESTSFLDALIEDLEMRLRLSAPQIGAPDAHERAAHPPGSAPNDSASGIDAVVAAEPDRLWAAVVRDVAERALPVPVRPRVVGADEVAFALGQAGAPEHESLEAAALALLPAGGTRAVVIGVAPDGGVESVHLAQVVDGPDAGPGGGPGTVELRDPRTGLVDRPVSSPGVRYVVLDTTSVTELQVLPPSVALARVTGVQPPALVDGEPDGLGQYYVELSSRHQGVPPAAFVPAAAVGRYFTADSPVLGQVVAVVETAHGSGHGVQPLLVPLGAAAPDRGPWADLVLRVLRRDGRTELTVDEPLLRRIAGPDVDGFFEEVQSLRTQLPGLALRLDGPFHDVAAEFGGVFTNPGLWGLAVPASGVLSRYRASGSAPGSPQRRIARALTGVDWGAWEDLAALVEHDGERSELPVEDGLLRRIVSGPRSFLALTAGIPGEPGLVGLLPGLALRFEGPVGDVLGGALAERDLTGERVPLAGMLGRYQLARLTGSTPEAAIAAVVTGRVDLSGVGLSDADLSRTDLRGTRLPKAVLARANLFLTDLRDADLRDSDLRGAKLLAADLVGARLAGADLRGAQLSRARLDAAALVGALFDAGVVTSGVSLQDLTGALSRIGSLPPRQTACQLQSLVAVLLYAHFNSLPGRRPHRVAAADRAAVRDARSFVGTVVLHATRPGPHPETQAHLTLRAVAPGRWELVPDDGGLVIPLDQVDDSSAARIPHDVVVTGATVTLDPALMLERIRPGLLTALANANATALAPPGRAAQGPGNLCAAVAADALAGGESLPEETFLPDAVYRWEPPDLDAVRAAYPGSHPMLCPNRVGVAAMMPDAGVARGLAVWVGPGTSEQAVTLRHAAAVVAVHGVVHFIDAGAPGGRIWTSTSSPMIDFTGQVVADDGHWRASAAQECTVWFVSTDDPAARAGRQEWLRHGGRTLVHQGDPPAVAELRSRHGRGGVRADEPLALPAATAPRAALPPARADVQPGNPTGGLDLGVTYPGPRGPWVAHHELGDTLHTLAALWALHGPTFAGQVNVLARRDLAASRVVDLFHRALPAAAVVVHVVPDHRPDVDAFFRDVKSGPADGPALGHPFDATRVFGQQVGADPAVLDRLRSFLRALATRRERAGAVQYLAEVDARLLDPSVPKGIVGLRCSADGYGAERDSTVAGTAQLVDLLRARGRQVVLMGTPPPGFVQPDGVVDLTGHWRRVSDLPAQVQAISLLAAAGTGVAVGPMSGLLDLVSLSADMPVVQIGPAFRMGMWEAAMGPSRFRVVPVQGLDATAPSGQQYGEGVLRSIRSAIDELP